jgi:hypothetical protein
MLTQAVFEGPVKTPQQRFQGKEYYANVPREVILHRLNVAHSLEERLYWAIVLLSWCGPGTCDYAALKTDDGYLMRRSTSDAPTPAKARDLMKQLRMAPWQESKVSRVLQVLERQGSIERSDGKIRPVRRPEATAADSESTPPERKFHIAGMTVRLDEFQALDESKTCSTCKFSEPGDEPETCSTDKFSPLEATEKLVSTDKFRSLVPAEREALEKSLEDLSTQWRNDLKALKYKYKDLLVQRISGGDTLIYLNSRLVGSSSSSVSTVEVEEEVPETTTTTPEPDLPDPEPPEPLPPPRSEAPRTPAVESPKPDAAQRLVKLAVYRDWAIDTRTAGQILTAVREHVGDVKIAEVDRYISAKARVSKTNLVGLIITDAEFLTPEAWERYRVQGASDLANYRRIRENAEEQLRDPELPDYQRERLLKDIEETELFE